MILELYYCDICKKRIKKNQKVWFGGSHEYHFNCKYKENFPIIDPIDVFLDPRYNGRKCQFHGERINMGKCMYCGKKAKPTDKTMVIIEYK